MGGAESSFQTTCWTEITDSRTSDESRTKLIINNLLSRYWKPVYCYLRRRGFDNESAKDLTQGFFHEIVLGRELIRKADNSKGRFRTFLLTALDRYVINMHNQQTAAKRYPSSKVLGIDDVTNTEVPIAVMELTPQESFCYALVSDILDRILSEVEIEFTDTDRDVYWKVFRERCLNPIMNNKKAPSLPEIRAKYAIESEGKISNMIVTVKRRLRKALEHHLSTLVQSDREVNQELHELLSMFVKK
jgi:RNA polymerase sigma-70 factor (ECF subfamily)